MCSPITLQQRVLYHWCIIIITVFNYCIILSSLYRHCTILYWFSVNYHVSVQSLHYHDHVLLLHRYHYRIIVIMLPSLYYHDHHPIITTCYQFCYIFIIRPPWPYYDCHTIAILTISFPYRHRYSMVRTIILLSYTLYHIINIPIIIIPINIGHIDRILKSVFSMVTRY